MYDMFVVQCNYLSFGVYYIFGQNVLLQHVIITNHRQGYAIIFNGLSINMYFVFMYFALAK